MISSDQMSEGDDLEDYLFYHRLEGIIFTISLPYPSKLGDSDDFLVFWYHEEIG